MRTAEVLETVPGVIISQHSGEGKANQYYLRGFNLDHGTDFATTVAGMPVNMPTHGHGHGYSDLNFLIPELVSGVQFSKGPYFAEQGDFATAGRRQHQLHEQPGQAHRPRRRRRRRVSPGRWPRRRRALGGGTLLGAFEVQHNDGPWMRPDDYRKVNGVVRYTRGDTPNGYSVTAWATTATGTRPTRCRAAPWTTARSTASASLDTSDGGDSYRYSGSFEWQRTANNASTTRHRLRHRLRPQPLLELHLLARRSRQRRPVPPGRSPVRSGGRVSHRRLGQWGGRADAEHLRPADPQRRHRERRALSHRAAGNGSRPCAQDEVLQTSGAALRAERDCRGRRGCGRWRASAWTATASTSRPASQPIRRTDTPGWSVPRAAR